MDIHGETTFITTSNLLGVYVENHFGNTKKACVLSLFEVLSKQLEKAFRRLVGSAFAWCWMSVSQNKQYNEDQ